MSKPKAIKEEVKKEDIMGEIKIEILKDGNYFLKSINHMEASEGKEPEALHNRVIEKILFDLHKQMFETRIVESALESFRNKLMP